MIVCARHRGGWLFSFSTLSALLLSPAFCTQRKAYNDNNGLYGPFLVLHWLSHPQQGPPIVTFLKGVVNILKRRMALGRRSFNAIPI